MTTRNRTRPRLALAGAVAGALLIAVLSFLERAAARADGTFRGVLAVTGSQSAEVSTPYRGLPLVVVLASSDLARPIRAQAESFRPGSTRDPPYLILERDRPSPRDRFTVMAGEAEVSQGLRRLAAASLNGRASPYPPLIALLALLAGCLLPPLRMRPEVPLLASSIVIGITYATRCVECSKLTFAFGMDPAAVGALAFLLGAWLTRYHSDGPLVAATIWGSTILTQLKLFHDSGLGCFACVAVLCIAGFALASSAFRGLAAENQWAPSLKFIQVSTMIVTCCLATGLLHASPASTTPRSRPLAQSRRELKMGDSAGRITVRMRSNSQQTSLTDGIYIIGSSACSACRQALHFLASEFPGQIRPLSAYGRILDAQDPFSDGWLDTDSYIVASPTILVIRGKTVTYVSSGWSDDLAFPLAIASHVRAAKSQDTIKEVLK